MSAPAVAVLAALALAVVVVTAAGVHSYWNAHLDDQDAAHGPTR